MDDTQKWYQSRSVLTGLVSVAAMVATFLGVEFSAADQQTLITAVLSVAGAIAGVASIWFRVVAKKQIVP
jgi:Mg2+ and Co2+ transporter CorA